MISAHLSSPGEFAIERFRRDTKLGGKLMPLPTWWQRPVGEREPRIHPRSDCFKRKQLRMRACPLYFLRQIFDPGTG